MGQIRNFLLGVVADVMAEIRYDPVGAMTLQEATELLAEKDLGTVTVTQAERLLNVIEKVQAHAPAEARPVTSAESIPPGYSQVTDPTTLAKLAAQYGVDPSNLQVFAPQQPGSPDDLVNTVNGPIKRSEIPLDADGNPDAAWVDENCDCPEHRQKRQLKAAEAARRAREGDGGYV